jgi:FkbM family methyltransferase
MMVAKMNVEYSDDCGEFSNAATEGDILGCFRLLLGRLPSKREYKEHSCRVGQPLDVVTASFLNSPEFTERKLIGSQQFRAEIRELEGFRMFVTPDDLIIGREIYETGNYEVNVSAIFWQMLRPGMRVLDIGANVGFYSLLSASRVGPQGRVWAIEPSSRNVTFLLASKQLNQFLNLEIIQAAASDRWEVLSFFADSTNGITISRSASDPSGYGETVQALPAATVIPPAETLDIVKIDIEGSEGKAVLGIYELLRNHKPAVFSEFSPESMMERSEMVPEEYLELFYSLGYQITTLLETGPVRCGTERSRVLEIFKRADKNHIDILATPI